MYALIIRLEFECKKSHSLAKIDGKTERLERRETGRQERREAGRQEGRKTGRQEGRKEGRGSGLPTISNWVS